MPERDYPPGWKPGRVCAWNVLVYDGRRKRDRRLGLLADREAAVRLASRFNLRQLDLDIRAGRKPSLVPVAYVVPQNEH